MATTFRGRPRAMRLKGIGLLLSIAVLASATGPVAAQEAAPQPAAVQADQAKGPVQAEVNGIAGGANDKKIGRLLRIPAPITSNVDSRIRRVTKKLIDDAKRNDEWPVLVFEFQPGNSDFGKAYDLADYISTLTGATTVAYLPQTVKGHAVLVALACDQIIMAEDAQIGEAGAGDETISPAKRSVYVDIANRRRTVPADLALGMLDPALEVWEIETDVSREFVLSTRLDELRKQKTFVMPVKPLIPAGEAALFTGAAARSLGFVSYLAKDRQDVAKALGLPASALTDDPSLDGAWRPVRVQIKGPVTPQVAGQTQKIIQDQILQRDANFIVVMLDSPGGDPQSSLSLANFLTGLDPGERRTVAYITGEARADAAYIALACDHIVMHPEAVLGGVGASQIEAGEVQLTAQAVEEIAKQKSRSPSLAAAMVDPTTTVYRYVREADGLTEFMTEVEARRQQNPKGWKQGQQVTEPGRMLKVDGNTGLEYGLVHEVVDSFDEFKVLYGLEHDPQLVESGWADTFIDALGAPGVGWFLLFLGGAALYIELQSPGVGVGAFVAAVCFLLFFWSNYLGGTAGWLEVLLFLLGVGCLLLELFVLPGTAIFGLGGIVLIVTSVVLATQTYVGLPKNEYQATELRNGMLMVTGVGIGLAIVASLAHRYLPRAPMFSRMMLEPPSDMELAEIARRESLASFEHFLGRQGETVTQLMPAGKARIDEELINVISSGELIERGKKVVVIEARGNRVVVREAMT